MLSMLFTHYSPFTNFKLYSNVEIEFAWALIPSIILTIIIVPSINEIRKLEKLTERREVDLSVKITGYQWYWVYDYLNFSRLSLSSYITSLSETPFPNYMNPDNSFVVPRKKNLKLMITSNDVIHSWAVPRIGVKLDGVPGRLNIVKFNPNRPGVFFGQCSELCGINHRFMPIKLEVLTPLYFINWVKSELR